MMEYDIHTLLDLLTLAASLWAIYIVRFQLKETYQADLDSVKVIYVVCTLRPGTLTTNSSCMYREMNLLRLQSCRCSCQYDAARSSLAGGSMRRACHDCQAWDQPLHRAQGACRP